MCMCMCVCVYAHVHGCVISLFSLCAGGYYGFRSATSLGVVAVLLFPERVGRARHMGGHCPKEEEKDGDDDDGEDTAHNRWRRRELCSGGKQFARQGWIISHSHQTKVVLHVYT